MTFKPRVECDWHGCGETTIATDEGEPASDEWGRLTGGEHGRDLCPLHLHRATRWVGAGVSEGDVFKRVKHQYVDNDGAEQVYFHGDTQSFWAGELLDERDEFPGYDPDEREGYFVSLNDHFTLYVIGRHKDEPLVMLKSDEFPTGVDVVDSEDSFEWRDQE